MAETAIARPVQQGSLDEALRVVRASLPEHGFKLVWPPPIAGGSVFAFASVWRRGEVRSVSHKSTTAARALLRAAEFELEKIQSASAPAACARCSRSGRFVTNSETFEICSHIGGTGR